MTLERKNLEKVMRALERLQRDLDYIRSDVSSMLGESMFAPPEYLVRPLKLWKKIKDVGETVTKDQYQVIGKSLGYDPRGLAGFLHGPDSSLVKLGNERIGLREWASEEVEKYKQWLESQ
jgi:tetrahydromethanopterin S-methyltransferase subunit G